MLRVPPSERGHAVTSLMAQMDHGAAQRFFALVDTSGVVSMESEPEKRQRVKPCGAERHFPVLNAASDGRLCTS